MARTHKTYATWRGRKATPQIKLSGQWLHAAGFTIATPFTVHTTATQLILTLTPPTQP